MSGSSRFSELTSAQAGEIERRLHALEKRMNEIGARASTNSRDIAGDLGDVIASALSGWADRFRQGASTVGDQSAALGKDAARLGAIALDRIEDESRHTASKQIKTQPRYSGGATLHSSEQLPRGHTDNFHTGTIRRPRHLYYSKFLGLPRPF